MSDSSTEAYDAAIARWVAALNRQGDPALLNGVLAPDVRIERYGYDDEAHTLVEVINGAANAAKWAALVNFDDIFTLVGPVTVAPNGVAEVRYRYAIPTFVNSGTWRFRVDAAGRLAWLSHAPDSIDGAATEVELGDWRTVVDTVLFKRRRRAAETATEEESLLFTGDIRNIGRSATDEHVHDHDHDHDHDDEDAH